MRKEGFVWRRLRDIIVAVGLVMLLVPMYLVIVNTFKSLQEAGQDFFALPQKLNLSNYIELFTKNNYWMFVKNSTYISLVSILLVVIFVPAVAYAIARNSNHKYYNALYAYLLMGMFIPFQVIMLPVTKQMTKIGLLNPQGLIMLYLSLSLPRGVFLFVNYIRGLPIEIEEAARIDGCNAAQVYFRIVLYLVKPMLATLVIMDMLWFWNDFMLPLLILSKTPDYWTLPLFQYNFKTQYSFNYTMAFTAYFTSMIPIIAVYCAGQKYIIKGLTAGAVKS